MPNRILALVIVFVCGLTSLPVVFSQSQSHMTDDAKLRERAMKLHREAIVIDTHNDITSAITDRDFDLGAQDKSGRTQTDIPRMKAGGLDADFFAIYVAAGYARNGGAARRALDMIDGVYEQVRRHPESLEMAFAANDIRRIHKTGKIAALMGIEGGHAIEDSLSALRQFYRLGVRYMTLTHSNTNNWADSSGDINNPNVKHHNGLTDFGREVVREMNRLGMMVDISHVADKTFWDAIEMSQAPVIASHSSARALTDAPRNMTDDMLKAVAKKGGVVMVNFGKSFVNTRYVKPSPETQAKMDEIRNQYSDDRMTMRAKLNELQGPPPHVTLDMLIDHFVHIARIAGIDHVGIGSDFDGVGGQLPEGMEDISKLPAITYELLKRGYSDADVKKVLGENFLRTMAEVERVAKKLQASGAKPSTAKIGALAKASGPLQK
ncbi:MAG: dipeptidase [Acidobacteria bacterium]|nr:dipeptidase [Acidobacteriota bacterium]